MALPTLSGLLAVAALAAPSAAQSSLPTVRFRVKLLESLGGAGEGMRDHPRAINGQGEVVGSVAWAGGSIAAHWAPSGALTLLVNGQADASSLAYDISPGGLAIGRIVGGTSSEPFQWTASSGKVALPLAEGAVPLAINETDTIAFSFPSDPSVAGATWRLGVQTPIAGAAGDLLVRGINSFGAVTGIAGGGELPARAFHWSSAGGLVELATPAGFSHAHGNALNDDGVVVGLARSAAGDRALRWNPGAQPLVLPLARATDTHASATSVNGQGWIVGFEFTDGAEPWESLGVVWIDDRAYSLNSLLAPLPIGVQVQVTEAFDVNEQGQIAARGIVNGVERALRLDP